MSNPKALDICFLGKILKKKRKEKEEKHEIHVLISKHIQRPLGGLVS